MLFPGLILCSLSMYESTDYKSTDYRVFCLRKVCQNIFFQHHCRYIVKNFFKWYFSSQWYFFSLNTGPWTGKFTPESVHLKHVELSTRLVGNSQHPQNPIQKISTSTRQFLSFNIEVAKIFLGILNSFESRILDCTIWLLLDTHESVSFGF